MWKINERNKSPPTRTSLHGELTVDCAGAAGTDLENYATMCVRFAQAFAAVHPQHAGRTPRSLVTRPENSTFHTSSKPAGWQ